jgi:hypothetical protein
MDAKVGDRVSYRIPGRGSWSYGFGDVRKVNRKSYTVVDRKFPGEEMLLVDKGLVIQVTPAPLLISLTLTQE